MANKGTILLRDKSERFSFRLDAETARQLHEMSDELGMAPSAVIRCFIQHQWILRNHAQNILTNVLSTSALAEAVKAAQTSQPAVAERAANNEDHKAD